MEGKRPGAPVKDAPARRRPAWLEGPRADRGIFDAVDAAMMVHPQRRTMVGRGGLACVSLTVRYHGKASHASSAPELGVSALDAVLQLFFGTDLG